MSEVYPHVILENLTTPLGLRIGNVLKHLFPVPKADSKRIVTFANRGEKTAAFLPASSRNVHNFAVYHILEDQISFRHHVYKKGNEGPKDIELEVVLDVLSCCRCYSLTPPPP
jgi:U3 small nucleolar ribonucleoprotein protein IMP4